MEWSTYQTAIFDELRDGRGDVVAVARAGSGKTTTLVEGLAGLPRDVLLCAFNKRIQEELQSRVTRGTVKTLHALGLGQYRRGRNIDVVPDKMRDIAKDLLKQPKYRPLLLFQDHEGKVRENVWSATAKITRLCGVAKNLLVTSPTRLLKFAHDHDLVDHWMDAGLFIEAVTAALEMAIEQSNILDYDDMLWFPSIFEDVVNFEQFSHVLVDEAQDLNNAQIWLVRRLVGERVVAFGDSFQAIYLFRGADREAFAKLTSNATKLKLPISYRCAKSIVEMAQHAVPDIESAPGAAHGDVKLVEYQALREGAKAGDFVLSRTNAPLLAVCLDMLRREVPATIAGSDIGRQLRDFIDMSKTKTTRDLRAYVDRWITEERAVSLPDHPDRYARALDRASCVRVLAEGCRTTFEVRKRLDRLFSDGDPVNSVVCSTVHKAKGLERDRVWLLHDTFGYHRPQKWHNADEERNIWYVAVTRARDALYFVETPVGEIMG